MVIKNTETANMSLNCVYLTAKQKGGRYVILIAKFWQLRCQNCPLSDFSTHGPPCLFVIKQVFSDIKRFHKSLIRANS